MARVLWACWDGGGNLPPSLGIAAELQRRGHEVSFHGRPDMVDRARGAGVSATALLSARDDVERYSFHPLPTVFGYTGSPGVGHELVQVAETERREPEPRGRSGMRRFSSDLASSAWPMRRGGLTYTSSSWRIML
jgi:hypothetical protein